jgi:antitoxin MazE
VIYIDREKPMSKAHVVKWGNSLAVRIPKTVAQKARVQEGDSIVVEALDGQIRVRRTERVPTLEELVARITPENRYEEPAWGRERGKEIVEW